MKIPLINSVVLLVLLYAGIQQLYQVNSNHNRILAIETRVKLLEDAVFDKKDQLEALEAE